ncbi:hypothetical protein [Streptomyces sp. NPDC046939]|uniref:hypothetical protein n=1 Tax=Streptomyces sp. NPDC046939 TaxID=3155376 RepID=UPI0034099557
MTIHHSATGIDIDARTAFTAFTAHLIDGRRRRHRRTRRGGVTVVLGAVAGGGQRVDRKDLVSIAGRRRASSPPGRFRSRSRRSSHGARVL